MIAQVKSNRAKGLPRGKVPAELIDRGETGANEASEVVPIAWLDAVFTRMMTTLGWVNQGPFDDTHRRNLTLTLCNWANPVGTKTEHRISEAVVKRYIRRRLQEQP
jgi:hypothetical protein